MRPEDSNSSLYMISVALAALCGAGCIVRAPDQNIFPNPEDRLLFEACDGPANADSAFGPADTSSAVRGDLALGELVDRRLMGNALYVAEVTYKRAKEPTLFETVEDVGCLLFGWYGNYECFSDENDSTEFITVTEFVPVVARPPIDSVLLADLQRFLGEERSGAGAPLHDPGGLLLDVWLIETQVTQQSGLIKVKVEGRVGIDVQVSDAATGDTLWKRSFNGVGTQQGMFVGKARYRRALSDAYCDALGMIKTALDSRPWRQPPELAMPMWIR